MGNDYESLFLDEDDRVLPSWATGKITLKMNLSNPVFLPKTVIIDIII
jgi:hypothetical protein